MPLRPWVALSLVSVLGLSFPALALETVEEIETCMEKNQPKEGSIQSIEMRPVDRIGAERVMEAKIHRGLSEDEDNSVLMRFNAPPDMRGSALLMLEKGERNDMFMYLPELNRTRRVTSHMMNGSMFGTDFSYAEFERLLGAVSDASQSRKDDEEINGRAAYVIESVPGEDSEYELVKTFVDQKTCAPLAIEYYERGAKLRKRMEVNPDRIVETKGKHVPREITMKDLRDGTETRIVILEMEIGVDIPRKTFTQRELERSGR